MIQLRHVPEDLHRKLKLRAAADGKSLSEYLISEIRKSAERPTTEELRQRMMSRSRVKLKTSVVEMLRAERNNRRSLSTPR